MPSVSFAPITNPIQQVAESITQQRHEKESEAHKIFRDAAGHAPKGVLPQTVNPVRSHLIFTTTLSQLDRMRKPYPVSNTLDLQA